MTHWSDDVLEVGCPDCNHPHLVPADVVGVPIVCERCGTEFQILRRRVSRRQRPRSAYLSTLRGGEEEGPSSRSLGNVAMTVLGLAVLVALLALIFDRSGDLAGPMDKVRELEEKVLDSPPKPK